MKFTLPLIALFGAVASVSATPDFDTTKGTNVAFKATGMAAGGYAGHRATHYLADKMPVDTKYDTLNKASQFLKDNSDTAGYVGAIAGAFGGYNAAPTVTSFEHRSRQAAATCSMAKDKSAYAYRRCMAAARRSARRPQQQAAPTVVPANARVECGFEGITQDECESRQCQWSPLAPPESGPWCHRA